MRPSKCLRVLPPAHRIHPFSRLAAGCTPSTCSPPPPPSPHRCGFTANGGLATSPANAPALVRVIPSFRDKLFILLLKTPLEKKALLPKTAQQIPPSLFLQTILVLLKAPLSYLA